MDTRPLVRPLTRPLSFDASGRRFGEFLPSDVLNGLFWFSPERSALALVGSNVSNVDDLLDANEQDIFQLTAADQPEINLRTLNNKALFDFDGVTQHFDSNIKLTDYDSTELNIYVTCIPDVYSGTQYVIDNGDDIRGMSLYFSGANVAATIAQEMGGSKNFITASGASNVAAGEARILRLRIVNGDTVYLYENDTLIDSVAFTSGWTVRPSFVNYRVGTRVEETNSFFDGAMQDIFFCQEITDTEHTNLMGYLNAETGLA